MDKPELLSRLVIFSGFSANHLSQIAQLIEVLNCDLDEIIFQAGDEASHLYGVVEGEVDLVLIAKDENLIADVQYEEYTHVETETLQREIIVDSIGPGEVFGWSALTPSGQFTSKAVCSKPAKIAAIPAKSLKTLFNDHPQVGFSFMERLVDVVSKRLANRTDKLLDGWSQAFNVNRI